MGEEAIILISTGAGQNTMENVYREIKSLDGVEKVAMIVGEYDVIAWISAEKSGEISRIIKSVRTISGVEKTTTNVVIKPR